jgi:hypothetical protein
MNWYKKAQLTQTIPYFQEFEDMGDYVPNEESLGQKLQEQFNTHIVSDIGQGDSGVAYLLANGDVLKITTNSQEGQVANYILNNPSPSVIEYKAVWKEGDLYYIIMEKINEMAIDYPEIEQQFHNLEPIIDKHNAKDPLSLYNVVKRDNNIDENFKMMLLPYLFYLQKLPFKVFDFTNVNNVGVKDGKLIFFDIT